MPRFGAGAPFGNTKQYSLFLICAWLAKLTKYLIIEFIPKTDEKVQLLLAEREDVFSTYSEIDFVNAFEAQFKIMNKSDKSVVGDTQRVLYLMERK